MPRAQISIKLEQETLKRVDEAAEILDYTRTGFIERAVNLSLNNLDTMVDEMEQESPITAVILDAITTNPKIALALSKVFARGMTPEQIETTTRNLPKMRTEANRRKTAKKPARKGAK
jgi:predicted transcriptional regulator